jgi:hypothetical protein
MPLPHGISAKYLIGVGVSIFPCSHGHQANILTQIIKRDETLTLLICDKVLFVDGLVKTAPANLFLIILRDLFTGPLKNAERSYCGQCPLSEVYFTYELFSSFFLLPSSATFHSRLSY